MDIFGELWLRQLLLEQKLALAGSIHSMSRLIATEREWQSQHKARSADQRRQYEEIVAAYRAQSNRPTVGKESL